MRLVLLCFLFIASSAFAEGTYLTINGISHHFDRQHKYNETNVGLGVEQRLTADFSLNAGYYRNSFYKDTFYLGGSYTPLHLGPVGLGTSFARVTGYQEIKWAVVPTIQYENEDGVGVNVMFLPPIKSKNFGGAVGLQLKWRL